MYMHSFSYLILLIHVLPLLVSLPRSSSIMFIFLKKQLSVLVISFHPTHSRLDGESFCSQIWDLARCSFSQIFKVNNYVICLR